MAPSRSSYFSVSNIIYGKTVTIQPATAFFRADQTGFLAVACFQRLVSNSKALMPCFERAHSELAL